MKRFSKLTLKWKRTESWGTWVPLLDSLIHWLLFYLYLDDQPCWFCWAATCSSKLKDWQRAWEVVCCKLLWYIYTRSKWLLTVVHTLWQNLPPQNSAITAELFHLHPDFERCDQSSSNVFKYIFQTTLFLQFKAKWSWAGTALAISLTHLVWRSITNKKKKTI